MQLARITVHTIVATALWSTTSIAAPVELRSPDGLLSFEGEILEFNGTMLTVKTGHGVVNIPASAVQCFGDACPDGVEKGIATNSSTASEQPAEAIALGVGFSRPENREFLNELLQSNGLSQSGFQASFTDENNVAVARADGSEFLNLELLDDTGSAGMTITTEISSSSAPGSQNTSDWAAPNAATDQQLKVEALAVVASGVAGIDAISLENLARIYSGEITNWSAFGGNDIPILAMQTSSNHPGHQSLRDAVMAPFGKTVSNMTLTVPDDAALLSTLGIAPGGIAVVSTESLGNEAPVAIFDSCQSPSEPNEFDIATGRYPLTISTYANVGNDIQASAVGEFLDGIVKTTNMEIVDSDSARVDRLNAVLEATIPDELKSTARDFVQSVFSANRLAMTFQDGPVSDVVAARNRADFVRLSHAIAQGDYDDQEIMFLGFTSDGSDPGGSVQQSREAANSLLAAFRNFAPEAASRSNVTFLTEGHGNVGFTDCIPSGSGSATSFVEIWVRPKA